jgi:hypothetical protein
MRKEFGIGDAALQFLVSSKLRRRKSDLLTSRAKAQVIRPAVTHWLVRDTGDDGQQESENDDDADDDGRLAH